MSKSAVCETRSPCWKYKASPCPKPCVRAIPCSPCPPASKPVCERTPPCWKYRASPCPKPCVRSAPCSPCRPVCTPPVDRCRRSVDDCCDRERFSSSCSPLYSPAAPSVCCRELPPCYPRQRFTSSCSSPGPEATATRPDTECAPCDLDSYCIRSSPLSCNPCLGRRSFRHCSNFTRQAVPYCNWCYERVEEDSGRSKKKSRRWSRKSRSGSRSSRSRSRSSSVNSNVKRGSSASSEPFIDDPNKRVFMFGKNKKSKRDSRKSSAADSARRSSSKPGASVGDLGGGGVRRSTRSNSVDAQFVDEDNDVEEDGRPSWSRKASRKSSAADSARRSSSKPGGSMGDLDSGGVRRSTRSSSVGAQPVDEDNDIEEDGRPSWSRKASRKSSAADSARRSSSKPGASVGEVDYGGVRRSTRNSLTGAQFVDEDNDIEEDGRPSWSRKASRKSSAADSARRSSSKPGASIGDLGGRLSSINDNVRRNSSVQSPFVDNGDDGEDEQGSVVDRRRSSSVTSAPRSSSQQRDGRNSSMSRHSSRSSGVGGNSTTTRAHFSSKTKFVSSLKSIFRRRKTPYRRSSRAASKSRSSSSRSSVNRNERGSSASESDDEDEDIDTESADNLIKPLAECIAGIIHKSVVNDSADPCDDRCCGRIRAVPHPPGPCHDGRCSVNAWNPRDRFSLCSMPFYRSGHRLFTGTTQGASVAAYGRQQSRSGNAEFVPDAQNANRQTSLTTAGRTRSNSLRASVPAQNAAFISSMPPPGTSFPRPTITSTSSRQLSVAPPRPQFAGYREHYVTTTNQTVHVTQDQSFNYGGNVAARKSSEGGRGGVDNRNQSGATSADLGVSSDLLDDVIADKPIRHTASLPAAASASASQRSDRTPNVQDRELAAMFEETERSIMEAFNNTEQILR